MVRNTKNHTKKRLKEPRSKTVFGERLREARKRKELTQVAAATIVNFSPDTVSEHERGEITPDAYTAIHYAMSYGDPALVMHYCDECPINKLLRLKIPTVSLSQKAVSCKVYTEKLKKCSKQFLKIACDDEVGESEQKKFRKMVIALLKLGALGDNVLLYALEHGLYDIFEEKEKAAANSSISATVKAKI